MTTTKAKPKRSLSALLARLNACPEAREWASPYDSKPAKAWRECQRGDWQLWLVGQFSGDRESPERKRLVLCACECARLAPPIKHKDWEAARLNCLDVAEQWARDEGPTLRDVNAAAHATADAADAADAAHAAHAAHAAYAAFAAAHATAYATAFAAAHATAHATAYATAHAAYAETLLKAAAIVRRHYPWKVVKEYLE